MLKRKRIIYIVACAAFLLLYFAVSLVLKKSISDKLLLEYLSDSFLRLLLSIVLFFIIRELKYDTVGFKGITPLSLLAVLPVLSVSVNNFPFVAFLSGEAHIVREELLLPFAVNCFMTAVFEELIFRGLFFPWCIERTGLNDTRSTFKAVIASAAVFGLMHIFNVFTSSPYAVIMQVGYTFLFGAAMCFVMLETRCVWVCVLMHAVYNFGGLIFGQLGEGFSWSVTQIVLTASVAVLCAITVIAVIIKRKKPYKSFDISRENLE